MTARSAGEIVEDLRARKAGALDEFVREHTGPLFSTARGLGFQDIEAEELVSETLAAFLKGLERFEGRSRLKTYLFGILYHKASEAWRRRRRETPVEDLEALFESRFDAKGMWSSPPKGPEAEALSKETEEWINRCAERLSVDQRAAFFLKEVERESTEAICNILGVSGTNLRVLLFRARTKLRECLEKNWESSQK